MSKDNHINNRCCEDEFIDQGSSHNCATLDSDVTDEEILNLTYTVREEFKKIVDRNGF